MATQKPLYATRDFNDAGTTRTFERGEELKDCKPGELLNYKAAGLASEEKPKAEAAPATPTTPAA